MADLALYANFIEHARVQQNIERVRDIRNFRSLETAFEIPDEEFKAIYRLNKNVCLDLIQEIEPYIPSRRTTSIVAKTTVSACIRAVSLALNHSHFRAKYIVFPKTREARNSVKSGFYQKFGIPNILGCIDGTHIAIVRPPKYGERYFNRKRCHSLNAQIVCDSNLEIMSIDASHGGANHDFFIWQQHPLRAHMEHLHRTENESVWLLGDSGYPLRETMMTPIVDAKPGFAERFYTDLHCRARCTVERCIGVLKSCWRCLLVDRKLHYHPKTAGFITNACVVLHNVANQANITADYLTPEELELEASLQDAPQLVPPLHLTARSSSIDLLVGESTRTRLVERLWIARR